MARTQHQYVCQACGALAPKWAGRCEACGEWNCIIEDAGAVASPGGLSLGKGRKVELEGLKGESPDLTRLVTGIDEFERVCGGGLVPGSAVLIGGDPGIGKSTLVLQVLGALAQAGASCTYISGEEAVDQVRLRARRLGLAEAPVRLACETSLRDILATLRDDEAGTPSVVVIDSIQTIYADNLESAPGTVSQVRAAAQALISFAKKRGAVVILVGHVTKEGLIAGPRVLEHMVDTVLYFEGERSHNYRILRAVKNRFGATDEIGVFEMTDRGLREVVNPSALFLGSRETAVSGAAVFAGIEGSRPLLVEIEALVAASPLATPRRTVVGLDSGRLAMILAVLEARCGLSLAGRDVYLNVAGGLRIAEPAADLAVAAALVSSVTDTPVAAGTVVFGEIGLSGEIRPVSQPEIRLKEAATLGFTDALAPPGAAAGSHGVRVSEVDRLATLVARIGDGAAARLVTETRTG